MMDIGGSINGGIPNSWMVSLCLFHGKSIYKFYKLMIWGYPHSGKPPDGKWMKIGVLESI
jgi:hypothetical protein